jgi:deoxyribodipyrimidine photo-lyase
LQTEKGSDASVTRDMNTPILLWFRRDLRLSDLPMLAAAVATGRPIVPVFILDPETEAMGTAPLWRLGLSLADFGARLAKLGSRLILRRGRASAELQRLVAETGADAVHWSRLYEPAAIARDTEVKAGLKALGVAAISHGGHVLHEPWTVETGQGGFYRVYSPFWRAVQARPVADLIAPPPGLAAPDVWPSSEDLAGWHLGHAMQRGAGIVAPYQAVGEEAALARLDDFVAGPIDTYRDMRDRPDVPGTSRLSENLTYGEIAPARLWHVGARARDDGSAGAETFLREVVWRDFAYHLIYHTPHITTGNWRPEWDGFPWRGDNPDAERWRRGMTGEPFVDAAMREMYVTGTMHNRARMIVASYLTKHLMTHWRVGLDWFADCLTDWDPASNAMGWQWAAGSGPDAAPYFRVFNPETQVEKFDPNGAYRRRFIAEFSGGEVPEAQRYFDAVPKSWHLDRQAPYPAPVIDLATGRERALAAYAQRNS